MATQKLTVIFWNVWAWSQDGQVDDGQKLITRLNELIRKYQPDVFGINEVLVHQHDSHSSVIEHLQKLGYYCHFATISPLNETWLVGNLLASKEKPIAIYDHILGGDTQAARRHYVNCTVKAIEAELMIGSTKVTILVTYLSSLLPLDWKTHMKHRNNYELLIKQINNKNLIIGGDFNETKYMLPWLRLPKHFSRKTGTFLHPTWRLNGKKRFLVFANYDHMVYENNGQLLLQTFKVLYRAPSDHAPLLAIFDVA